MIVYRVINSKEKQKNQIFKTSKNVYNLFNTHIYNEKKDYIHFFKYNDFAEYYFELGKDKNNHCENNNDDMFMIANIPKVLLDKYKVFGFYIFNGEEIPIPEYAIPKEEFSYNYIVDLTNKSIDSYKRQNEDEEYKRYLELVQRLKNEGKTANDIAMKFLTFDLEELLGVSVDNRTEMEFQEILSLSSLETEIVKNVDDKLEEPKIIK